MACDRARRAGPSQGALQAAGAARTALRAQCTEVSLETVERYHLLKKFLAMLPTNLQAACEAPVLARQHVEYLDAPVMTQTLSRVGAFLIYICAWLCASQHMHWCR